MRHLSALLGGLISVLLASSATAQGTFPRFPADAVWNQDVSTQPADPNSATIIAASVGWGTGTTSFQIDFSMHIVYTAGQSTTLTPLVKETGYYKTDCDSGLSVPLPAIGAIEGSSNYTCNLSHDCHLFVVDGNNLYESYQTTVDSNGLNSLCLIKWHLDRVYPQNGRGDGCTSADAAGFPMAPLILGPDEVYAAMQTTNGDLGHAIRFVMPNERMRAGYYVYPASHNGAPDSSSPDAIPYGAHIRLKPGFDISHFNAASQVILRTMKKYGMFLSDGGSVPLTFDDGMFSTHKWTDAAINMDSHSLYGIALTDFDVMPLGTLVAYDNNSDSADCFRNHFAEGGTPATFTVTPHVGSNGTVAPASTQLLTQGAASTFTVTPSPGYVASVGGTCGGHLQGNTYTTNAVNADCNVNFKFVTGALTEPLVVWRSNSGTWYSLAANGTQSSVQWGLPGDKSFYLDMNNDGVADYVVWRPSTAVWYVRTSPSQSTITQFGLPSDIPLPATNWEPVIGGGISPAGSIAVWRPSTAVWYFTSGLQQFGLPSDIPLERTYATTGTAKSVYRPSTGVWYSDRTPAIQQFGLNGDVPVPGDYDGDGISDFAVWRPSTGVWYIMPSASPGTVSQVQFGLNGDMPVPHDYDGDGKTDMAVWRPSTGVWYVMPSSHPATPVVKQWGLNGDVPAYRPTSASP